MQSLYWVNKLSMLIKLSIREEFYCVWKCDDTVNITKSTYLYHTNIRIILNNLNEKQWFVLNLT